MGPMEAEQGLWASMQVLRAAFSKIGVQSSRAAPEPNDTAYQPESKFSRGRYRDCIGSFLKAH